MTLTQCRWSIVPSFVFVRPIVLEELKRTYEQTEQCFKEYRLAGFAGVARRAHISDVRVENSDSAGFTQ